MYRNLIKNIANGLLIFLMYFGTTEATTNVEVFQKYLTDVFIETGSFQGDGIQFALDAGYREVHSIELAPRFYKHCSDRFANNSKVHLYLGDSSIVLKDVLDKLKVKATFWLDGHYSAGVTALGNTNTPILQELALIAAHPIKNHTILVDDVRLFGTVFHDFIELQDIIDLIRQINPKYQFIFEPGHIEKDVLVAYIPEKN